MATREVLQGLLDVGWTKSRIAKKLGIDSSTLSQVASGKKPGRNLESPLMRLASGQDVGERERRKTKSGEPARVRQPSSKKLTQKRLIKTADGRIKFAAPTSLPYVAARRLGEIAQGGGKVSVRIVLRGGSEMVLFSRGGEYAARLEHRWAVFVDQNPGRDFFDFVVDLFNETIQNVNGESRPITEIDIQSVGFAVIYPDLAKR